MDVVTGAFSFTGRAIARAVGNVRVLVDAADERRKDLTYLRHSEGDLR